MERLRRLIYDAMIVPTAHTRVFDRDFQQEIYEVFHTQAITRWGHIVFAAIENVSLLAAATAFPLPPMHVAGWRIDGAMLSAIIALVVYFAVHGMWAALMIPVLTVAVVLAHLQAAWLGSATVSVSLEIAFAAALLLVFSHSFEPVPPPWSGTYRWCSITEFVRRTSPLKLVVISLLVMFVFPLLEFWAAPRIWPLQMTHLLMRAGVRPALASRMRDRVRAILSDARNGWPLPPMDATLDRR